MAAPQGQVLVNTLASLTQMLSLHVVSEITKIIVHYPISMRTR